jgi:hypothetical protein
LRWLVRFVSLKVTDATTRTLLHRQYVCPRCYAQFANVDACRSRKGRPVVLAVRANII